MFRFFVSSLAIGICLALPYNVLAKEKEQIKQVLNLEYVSYEDSLILAKKENKNIFIFFTGDYCGWCYKQKEVLMDQEVIKSLKDHIICFVDLSERKDLAAKYKVKSIPTYFIIDKDENVIKKHTGYKSSGDFMSWLGKSKKKWFR